MEVDLINVDDYQKLASQKLSKEVFDFCYGGSHNEISLKRNCQVFDEIFLLPQVLTGISTVKTRRSLLGFDLAMPLLSAPMAFQGLLNSEGEIALSQALSSFGLISIISTMSSYSLEQIMLQAGDLTWFQLYIFKDRTLTKELIARAVKTGCKAIVLTVDVPVMATRVRDIRNCFKLPAEIFPQNFQRLQQSLRESTHSSAVKNFTNAQFESSLTWKDVEWLKNQTDLPIILKGIINPQDAIKAKTYGIDGIIVSNHGGRQLDGVASSIEILPQIVKKIKGEIAVLIDGGIRRGSDILKALLLGADAVLIGRPLLWGLAVNGCQGVKNILNILKEELIESMILMGISELESLSYRPDLIYTKRKSHAA